MSARACVCVCTVCTTHVYRIVHWPTLKGKEKKNKKNATMTGYSLHLHCIQLCITSGLRFVCVHVHACLTACRFCFFFYICSLLYVWHVALLTGCLTGNSVFFSLRFPLATHLSLSGNEYVQFFSLEFDFGLPLMPLLCVHENWISFFIVSCLHIAKSTREREKRKKDRQKDMSIQDAFNFSPFQSIKLIKSKFM